jgi:ABC-type multidrug transport system ATPase subunit
MIELRAIYKSLGQKLILSNVSLSVRGGEIIGITGPIGSGKSTLLYILSGLLDPDSGSITIMGSQALPRNTHTLAHMNYASSGQRLSGYATVMENLVTYARLYSVKNVHRQITMLWKLFKMPSSMLQKRVYKLSSGENSFVNFVKALLNNPDILLLDEITSHMDPLFANRVRAHLRKRSTMHTVTIIVSQNLAELRSLCTRIIVLTAGKIIYDGKPRTVYTTQKYYE